MKNIYIPLMLIAPLIHFGASEFVSVSFFCFLFFVFFVIFRHSSEAFNAFLKVGGPLFFVALLKSAVDPQLGPLLINLREIAVIVLVLSIALVAHRVERPSSRVVFWVSIVVLAWSLAQLFDIYFITGGALFFPPESFFNLNYGTLASNLYSRFGNVARPSAGFSEPSSLGAFGICVFFIGATVRKYALTLIGGLLVVTSSSLSSMLGLAVLIVSFITTLPRKYFLLVAFGIGVAVLYAGQRLTVVFAGDDESTLQRLSFPIQLLMQHWSFWGLDKDSAVAFGAGLGATANIFDNFFLGKAITEGFYVFILIAVLVSVFNFRFFLLIVSMGFINGSPFYYDRFVLYAMVVLFCGGDVYRNIVMRRTVRAKKIERRNNYV